MYIFAQCRLSSQTLNIFEFVYFYFLFFNYFYMKIARGTVRMICVLQKRKCYHKPTYEAQQDHLYQSTRTCTNTSHTTQYTVIL